MNPVRIYDYLVETRQRVLDAVRPLTPEQYERRFGFGLGTLASTLAHIMISEWYYVERLEGRTVAPYERWPIRYEEPPAFEVVERTWREQAPKTRAAIAAERDWSRTITYLGFADDDGTRYHITATAGDFFTQLALHEVHHRAQALVMLRELGAGVAAVQDLDFNALMFARREAT